MPGAKRYADLYCYQVAVQIRREVLRLTRREPARQDFRFTSQIRDSARGSPRNIVEGYSRFAPTAILPFLSYAKASAHETANHVVDGRECGYFTDDEARELLGLIDRLVRALLRWIRYLESPAARRYYEQHRARRTSQEYRPRSGK